MEPQGPRVECRRHVSRSIRCCMRLPHGQCLRLWTHKEEGTEEASCSAPMRRKCQSAAPCRAHDLQVGGMCGDRGVASGLLAVQSKRCSCGFDSAVPAGQRFTRRLVCRNASTTLMRQKECVTQCRNN